MSYADGFVAAVPDDNKEKFIEHAKLFGEILKSVGALEVVDTWADDVPDGKLTSFPLAVKKEEGESVAFSWVIWPSKEVRDAGWKSAMEDPRFAPGENTMPFDGKRMIYGGFDVVSKI